MPIPIVSSVSPTHGVAGDIITLTGVGFLPVTDITVDLVSCPTFTIIDDNNCTAEVPTGVSPSPVYVQVFSPSGYSVGIDPDNVFTVDSAPPPPPPPGDVTCLTLNVPGFGADTVTADTDGICYTVQAIDGWFDSPPVRSGTLEASERGETVTVNRENARVVDVQIVAHTLDRQTPLGNVLCFTAIETIKTAFRAAFVPILMDVVDPSGQERTLLARRVGPIKQQILGNGAAVLFAIPMLGENPMLVSI